MDRTSNQVGQNLLINIERRETETRSILVDESSATIPVHSSVYPPPTLPHTDVKPGSLGMLHNTEYRQQVHLRFLTCTSSSSDRRHHSPEAQPPKRCHGRCDADPGRAATHGVPSSERTTASERSGSFGSITISIAWPSTPTVCSCLGRRFRLGERGGSTVGSYRLRSVRNDTHVSTSMHPTAYPPHITQTSATATPRSLQLLEEACEPRESRTADFVHGKHEFF